MQRFLKIFAIFFAHVITNSSFGATLCETNTESPIHRDAYVLVGGIQQWVTIHGEKCSNPVVLFLHGGPGLVDSPAARSQYQDWEGTFTVVQWDQRGAGLTYGANETPIKLTLEQMVSDGIKLSEYLIQELEQQKIILTGTSWGAALGMQMVSRRPDLYHAYVGRSVGVNIEKSLNASLPRLKTLAKSKDDQQSLDQLSSLNSNWRAIENVLKLQQIMERYKAPKAASDANYTIEPQYNNREYFATFQKAAQFSQSQTINATGGLAFEVDLYKLDFNFELPIFFIQGELDLMTMPEVTRAYFDLVKAPIKDYILVPGRGHDSAFIEDNYKVLTEKVLPLVRAQGNQ